MSTSKEMLSNDMECYKNALELLKEIGAIGTCEYHEGFFYDTGAYSYVPDSQDNEIYDLAIKKLNDYPIFDSTELLCKYIDKVMGDALYGDGGCPECQKNED